MGKFIDLTGQKHGKLTVIRRNGISKDRYIKWLCQCECGKQTIVRGESLKNGNTKSCGCLQKELLKLNPNSLKHGQSSDGISRIYKTWENMIERCTNPNHKQYKDYGGRGIKVCEAWIKFNGFFKDMGEKPNGLTLDRINNNGDYCKENCKWSTSKEQARNKTNNILITIDGITKCLAGWCEIYRLNYHTVCWRLNNGWTPEEALEIIPRKKRA